MTDLRDSVSANESSRSNRMEPAPLNGSLNAFVHNVNRVPVTARSYHVPSQPSVLNSPDMYSLSLRCKPFACA